MLTVSPRLPGPTGEVPNLHAGAAIETALDRHGPEIYRHLRRLTPTAEDAADLHQETFLQAYRAWSRLPAGANVRAWLFRIAVNVARDAHRRRRARPQHLPPPSGVSALDGPAGPAVDLGPAAGAQSDPHVRAAASELREAVRDALLTLSPRQRTAVVARVLEGRDYADLAEMLGCSEQTARQHASQGLRRLRRLIGPYLEGPTP